MRRRRPDSLMARPIEISEAANKGATHDTQKDASSAVRHGSHLKNRPHAASDVSAICGRRPELDVWNGNGTICFAGPIWLGN